MGHKLDFEINIREALARVAGRKTSTSFKKSFQVFVNRCCKELQHSVLHSVLASKVKTRKVVKSNNVDIYQNIKFRKIFPDFQLYALSCVRVPSFVPLSKNYIKPAVKTYHLSIDLYSVL